MHIPAGIFSNLFRKHLVELLYYKFYHQYLLIEPTSSVNPDVAESHWDVTQVCYCMKKVLLHQVIAFRRVYLAEALALNVLIDILVFCLTQSGTCIIMAALCVEALRRLMKL